MKYIDAEKLIAEIERRKSEIKSQIVELGNFESNEIGLFDYLDLYDDILSFITSLQQEQPEVDLEKFTEKMDAWKARYNYPDNIPIKAAMAFTARMFYQYPNVARLWYEQLPKATMD